METPLQLHDQAHENTAGIKPANTIDAPWKILIVDDEQLVHDMTHMVLRKLVLDNTPVQLVSVFSAKDAKSFFLRNDDVATVIVDVAIETQHAGLELVEWIRNEQNNHSTRIIIRTGQTDIASEEYVSLHYDINDFKIKTELTSAKLISSVLSSLRSYRDIRAIKHGRDNLKQVMDASSAILIPATYDQFGSSVLKQLHEQLGINSPCITICNRETNIYGENQEIAFTATLNHFTLAHGLNRLKVDPHTQNRMNTAFIDECPELTAQGYTDIFNLDNSSTSVLHIALNAPLSLEQQHTLALFCRNIVRVFEHLKIKEEVLNVQNELVMIIGDTIEMRDKATGSHVKRVSEICRLLAEKSGESKAFQEYIAFAAPLHDLGKIATPERILDKPGKLDRDEWEEMKRHAECGAALLEKSHRTVAKMGEKIARHHHENWDGSGYPDGLAGKNIPKEARIAAIADVFDALATNRPYKNAWPMEKIHEFFIAQSGQKFDPEIAQILIANFDEFRALRHSLGDENASE